MKWVFFLGYSHSQNNGASLEQLWKDIFMIGLLVHEYIICTIRRINTHGMKASLMSTTNTTYLSISQLAIVPFRWGWDSKHYVALMCPYHLQLLRQIRLMSSLKLTRLTTSLSTINTYSGRSTTYWIEKMLSTSN